MCYHFSVNSRHREIVKLIFSDPVNGNLKWSKVEALIISVGCQVIEGSGSSVTFEKDGIRAYFHRPHPQKESLRYRIVAVREFLAKIGVKP